MASMDDAATGDAEPTIDAPLSRAQKDDYRAAARDLWQAVTGLRAGWRGFDIHHRIPLEWAQIFPKADPNRLANLVAVTTEDHKLINQMWAQFDTALNGRTPSQAEVLQQAIRVDERFGSRMRFIDQFP